MPQSIERVRCWVEYWSWHIPVGSGHCGQRELGARELWWSLGILRHPGSVDLTLSVCNPIEAQSLVVSTRRQVAYDSLVRARDYIEFVAIANAELRKLFAEAGAMPPSLLPNGRLGARDLGSTWS